jgi:hypothetical protein
MDAVHDVVIGVMQEVAIVIYQAVCKIRRVRHDFGNRGFDRAEFSSGARLIAKDIEQDFENLIFLFLIPHRRKALATGFDGSDHRLRITRLEYRQKNIVAMTRQIRPTRRTLLIEGKHVAVCPEEIESDIAAEFESILVNASLHPVHDFRFGGSFFSKIPPNDRGELFEGREASEVKLGEKVAGKNQSSMTIYDKRLQ